MTVFYPLRRRSSLSVRLACISMHRAFPLLPISCLSVSRLFVPSFVDLLFVRSSVYFVLVRSSLYFAFVHSSVYFLLVRSFVTFSFALLSSLSLPTMFFRIPHSDSHFLRTCHSRWWPLPWVGERGWAVPGPDRGIEAPWNPPLPARVSTKPCPGLPVPVPCGDWEPPCPWRTRTALPL